VNPVLWLREELVQVPVVTLGSRSVVAQEQDIHNTMKSGIYTLAVLACTVWLPAFVSQGEAANGSPAAPENAGAVSRLLERIPAGFPRINCAGHTESAHLLTHFLWYHFHHRLGNSQAMFEKRLRLMTVRVSCGKDFGNQGVGEMLVARHVSTGSLENASFRAAAVTRLPRGGNLRSSSSNMRRWTSWMCSCDPRGQALPSQMSESGSREARSGSVP